MVVSNDEKKKSRKPIVILLGIVAILVAVFLARKGCPIPIPVPADQDQPTIEAKKTEEPKKEEPKVELNPKVEVPMIDAPMVGH